MKSKHLSILGLLLITLSIGACNKTPSNSNVSSSDTRVSSFESTHNVSSDNPGGGTPKRKYGKYTIKDEVEDISDLQGSPWLNTSIEGIGEAATDKYLALLMTILAMFASAGIRRVFE